MAVNVLKTHPAHVRYPDNVVSIHAEMRAILLAQTAVAGSTLYVMRYGGNSSRPCASCFAYMAEAGIRSVVYMLNGAIIKERLHGT